MTETSPVFQQTRETYLSRIGGVDMSRAAGALGFRRTPGGDVVRLLGREYRVTPTDIVACGEERPAGFDVCVLLSRYLIMCPETPDERMEWAAYRDFKDAGPLRKYFSDNVEGAVARHFSGRPAALAEAAAALGGRPAAEALSCDLKFAFPALPRVGMLLLFNDADEAFGADCRVLFQRRTESYLDMECAAILGGRLAAGLCRRG